MATTSSTSKQRVTLFLNQKLLVHAKAQSVIQDLTLTALVEKALVAYLPDEIITKKPRL